MDIERLEIDANGFTFTARAAGPRHGRPVILLHGFPQTWWCWRDVLVRLGEAGYRAVAPDQRGYSPRARPAGVDSYAVPRLAGDVTALADTMEMDTFDLVGHDWGGMLAWLTGARHADRVGRLAVVSTPHPEAMRAALAAGEPGREGFSESLDLFLKAEVPETILLGEDGSGSGLRAMLASWGLVGAAADEYVACLVQPGAMTAALNWYRALDLADVEGLPPIVVPTLYVWSTEDPVHGRAAAEATSEWVAGRYRFSVLEGVGHWIPELAPRELGDLLLDHLAEG